MDKKELKALRVRLKTGEYDGADIMQAWIAIDDLISILDGDAVVVPREPTEEMLQIGGDVFAKLDGTDHQTFCENAAEIYEAMIAAQEKG